MIFMILYIFSVLAALGLGVLAAVSDFKGMTIPNSISALVLVLFGVAFTVTHLAGVEVFASLSSHLLSGFLMLAITMAMFFLKMIGGGDSKLVTAFTFWFGIEGLIAFVFYMSLAGAVLGFIALYLKTRKPIKAPAEGSWLARVQSGENVVPYGIPITVGAFATLFYMGLLAPSQISLFLM